MDQSLENKINFKNKLINFYNFNKNKIRTIIIIFFITLVAFVFLKQNSEKKKIVVAEKYIQAGIYLTSNNKIKATELYEDIILSKNNFYSSLALNKIIEKNLILDKDKIIDYFSVLQKSTSDKNKEDLILLKKALYLIKISDIENGNDLLKTIIKNNSILKPIAQDILKK